MSKQANTNPEHTFHLRNAVFTYMERPRLGMAPIVVLGGYDVLGIELDAPQCTFEMYRGKGLICSDCAESYAKYMPESLDSLRAMMVDLITPSKCVGAFDESYRLSSIDLWFQNAEKVLGRRMAIQGIHDAVDILAERKRHMMQPVLWAIDHNRVETGVSLIDWMLHLYECSRGVFWFSYIANAYTGKHRTDLDKFDKAYGKPHAGLPHVSM